MSKVGEQMNEGRIAVLNLLKGAAPEREIELENLWKEYDPDIVVISPRSGLTMNANAVRIKFDTKVAEAFWLIAFSAWTAIEVYSPAIVLTTATGVPLNSAFNQDVEIEKFERYFKERIQASKSFILSNGGNFNYWPDDIPKPTADRSSLKTNQEKTCFDLTLMSLAFAFLHEFKHVSFLQKKSEPSDRVEEELACDKFACEFLTAKAGEYAKANDHSEEEVISKRMHGLAVGAFILHILTPEDAHQGTNEYPPISDRFLMLTDVKAVSECSNYWVFASCLLIGLLRIRRCDLEVCASNPKGLFEKLSKKYEQIAVTSQSFT